MRLAWALLPLLGALVHVACGDSTGGDPFATPSGGTSGAGGTPDEPGGAGGRGPDDDPTIGGPCLDDGQCDDDVDCTFDLCDDAIGRCRHHPDDTLCDDATYCNGSEVCDAELGCRAAAVPTCSDSDTCTIDTCVEATQSCRHEPRDADGDGDPVSACGGDDCRDDDPLVSSAALERCANLVDDDCDGSIDESDCTSPEHDTCVDALEVEEAGAYELDLAGAAADYAFSCAENAASLRDVVVAVMVPEGDPVDVDIVVTVPVGTVLVAASTRCGRASGEVDCAAGVELEDEGSVARLIVRRPEPGALAVLVAGSAETNVLFKVAFRPSEPAPEHETCGTALPLEEGVVESATLVGVATDLETACATETGELVYTFELDEPRDVRVRAAALDDYGVPTISLRAPACVDLEDELTCRSASPTELFARALAPGRYYVALAATGPCDVELVLATEPVTEPPEDEGCVGSPEAELGVTTQISLANHEDAVRTGCLVGAPDAARSIELAESSDLLVVQTGSDGDLGATLIATPNCETREQTLACRRSDDFPLRTVAHGVGPGSLRVVLETAQGNPTALTAFSRPARETVLVHRADDCDDPFEIPETGGRFEGNTQNAFADYEASCDYGGQPAGGAPEQVLMFTLSVPRRMVFDLQGSDFDTLLVVRDDLLCPGNEIPGTCRPGYESSRSFLDVDLDSGTYYLQIDGYNGASGAWVLEVFSAEL